MKRVISAFCAIVLAVSIATTFSPTAYAIGSSKRIINVVYDNSGSMYKDYGYREEPRPKIDRWSQALYAMEVFATMLGEQDEMNVFYMNDNGASPATVRGSQRDRVDALVKATTSRKDGNTGFPTVTAAYNALKQSDAAADRWLVVLTDGNFNGSDEDRIRYDRTLNTYAEEGIHVVFLAIQDENSKDSIHVPGKTANDFYVFEAESSSAVLGKVTAIANMIFQRQILPSSHQTISGNKIMMDIDIPVKQILVFAQGEKIKISSLTVDGTELSATESSTVLVDDKTMEGQIAASDLNGLVQTYTAPDDKPYQKGSYELTISDTSNVEIYYIAGAEIDCYFVDDNGNEVNSGETHYEGDYGVRLAFFDPLTGDILDSDLLDGAEIHAEMTSESGTQQIDANVDRVHLPQGEVTLDAWAVLPGDVTVQSPQRKYTVFPKPIELGLTISLPGDAYKLSALGEQSRPIEVIVTNQETSQRLSQEEWDATELTIKSSSNVKWLISKGSEVGTWEIRPDYVTDMSDTDTGSIPLTVSAEYNMENQQAFGSASTTVTIVDYVNSELKLTITPPSEPIYLGSIRTTVKEQADGSIASDPVDEDSPQDATDTSMDTATSELGALLSIYTKDEYTGEYLPLTKAQRRNLQLEISGTTADGDKLSWTISSTDDDGVFMLRPNLVEATSFSLKHLDETVELNVTVVGVLEDGELVYRGADSAIICVHTKSLLDIIKEFLATIVVSSAVLFVLLGHLFKKKLKWKQLKPYCQDVNTGNRVTVEKKRNWLSYILPWVPQSAKINVFSAPLHCPFSPMTIRAAGGGQFRIVNCGAYSGANITINGTKVTDKTKKKKFTHVTLNNLDAMGNPVGRAHI